MIAVKMADTEKSTIRVNVATLLKLNRIRVTVQELTEERAPRSNAELVDEMADQYLNRLEAKSGA